MGQEAYAMFPMLARAAAEAQLARAQAGNYGIQQQQFQQGNQAASAFGNAFGNGAPVPGAQPGPYPMPPEPGQASQPMNPASISPDGAGFQPFKPAPAGIRVPQAGGPAMTGPVSTGPADDLSRASDLPQAAQPPAPAASPAGAPHKWTPAPGETFNTPDGSRPRTLDEVMAALRKGNPKADPATLARAAGLYLPWMTEEDQVRLREAMMQNTAAMKDAQISAQRDIAGGRNETTLAVARERIDAAQRRADMVNQRALTIAAQVNTLGQQKLAAARQANDGRAALAAKKELRMQQATITSLNTAYSNAMTNANYITDDAQRAAAIEAATQAREQGLDALNALPNPLGDQETTPKIPKLQRGQEPTDAQRMEHPSFDESQKLLGPQSMLRKPANSQLALAQLNAKRGRLGMKSLPAIV